MSSGGALLGEGSYGCAFMPAFPCRNQRQLPPPPVPVGSSKNRPGKARDIRVHPIGTEVEKNTISKIFVKPSSLQEEVHNQSIIHALDPEGKYFVSAQSTCDTTLSDIMQDPDAAKCTLLQGLANAGRSTRFSVRELAFPTLKVPYGGVSLKDAMQKHMIATPRDLIVALSPVAKGMVAIARAHYIHHDITPGNIVYDRRSGQCRLIDYGLTLPFDGIYDPNDNPYLFSRYMFHPPEYRVFEYLYTIKAGMHSVATPGAMAGLKSRPARPPAPQPHSFKIASINEEALSYSVGKGKPMAVEMITTKAISGWSMAEYTTALNRYSETVLKKVSSRAMKPQVIDTWGLGMTIISLIPYFTPEQAAAAAGAGLSSIIHELVHPDPRERATPTKIVKMFQAFTAATATAP